MIALAALLIFARGPVIAAFLMLAFLLAEPENRKIRPLLLRPFMKQKTEAAAPSDSTVDVKGEKNVKTETV
jgi:hypothetical protein